MAVSAEELIALRPMVVSTCYRMLASSLPPDCDSKEEAEDVASEVILAALQGLPSFREEATLSTWLFRITSNRCKNRIAKVSIPTTALEIEIKGENLERYLPDHSSSPLDYMSSRSAGQEIALAAFRLAAIQYPDNAICHAMALNDVTYAEISRETGISVQAVKSRIHRSKTVVCELVHEGKGLRCSSGGTDPMWQTLRLCDLGLDHNTISQLQDISLKMIWKRATKARALAAYANTSPLDPAFPEAILELGANCPRAELLLSALVA